MNRDHRRRECEGCGGSEPPFIHHVRQRGVFRRLCSDCLLKNHQGLFCPVCLHVFFDDVPPPHARLICLSCPSITHLSCSPPPSSSAAADASSASAPCFTCPPCSDPNFSFFPKSQASAGPGTPLDKAAAKALVAAAKIAAVSMARAATLAKNEADKRVREAAIARKRAREALERVHFLATRERDSDNPNKNNNNNMKKSG